MVVLAFSLNGFIGPKKLQQVWRRLGVTLSLVPSKRLYFYGVVYSWLLSFRPPLTDS